MFDFFDSDFFHGNVKFSKILGYDKKIKITFIPARMSFRRVFIYCQINPKNHSPDKIQKRLLRQNHSQLIKNEII